MLRQPFVAVLVALSIFGGAIAQTPVNDLARPGASALRKLDVPPDQSRSVATKLSLKFRDVPGVSITPDPSRGKLVVMAPATIQPKIAAELAELLTLETATQRVRVTLNHITTTEFENVLTGLSERPLATNTRGGGQSIIYNLHAAGLPGTSIEVDRVGTAVVLDAPADQVTAWRKVIGAIDVTRTAESPTVQIVRIHRAAPAPIQRAVRLLSRQPSAATANAWLKHQAASGATDRSRTTRIPARPAAFMQDGDSTPSTPDSGATAGADSDGGIEDGAGVFGDVQIEFVPELGQAIIRGSKKDVQRVRDVIRQIEQQSEVTKPDVEVVPLEYVDSNALATLLKQIYDDVLSARQGEVSVTALDTPNSLLLIGRTEAIRSLMDLIKKLDQPSDNTSRLRVFRLQHASAIDAESRIREFFVNRPGTDEDPRPTLGNRVRVEADYRTNSLIVSAAPRDLEEVARLISELDVLDIPAESQLKVFALSNSLAEDLATTIQAAVSGQAEEQTDTANANVTTPSTTLSILAVDAESGGLIESGLLAGAVITPDVSSNSLVVRAPSTSMPLIAELIRQLDQAPGADSLVKVFTIENGDALQLTTALQDLFGEDASTNGTNVGAGNLAGLPSSTAGGESTLVPLRFSTDQRTNSIIASGSADDLDIVESILLRLDTSGFSERITEVIWLRHQSAGDIAVALQEYIQRRTQSVNTIQQFQQNLGPFDLPDRDLIVVAEPVTNSLLLSVAPRLYEDIRRLIDQLDRRPPMVLIKTLIAEVDLSDGFEIGGELGIQDSLLFDRSIVGASIAGNPIGPPTAGNGTQGFNFNNATANANQRIAGAGNVAPRSLSTFGLGTSSQTFGYGGFVLSAASESVNLLFRSLQDANRLQILSRPQAMTLDNTDAFLQVGRQIARVNGVIQNGLGSNTLSIEDIEVGLILRIRPRVGSDGLILVEIDATRSARDDANGTTIPTGDGSGSTVTINDITRTTAQSTIAAYSGQTVVFGGLIQKIRSNQSRRVPFVSNIPVVGYLFRFDQEIERRSETLIVMTPTLVLGDEDLEYVKQVESSRMSWCLADVVEMHGDVGLSGGYGLWGPATGGTIYPDLHPTYDQFCPGANGSYGAAPTMAPGVVVGGPTHISNEGLQQVVVPQFDPKPSGDIDGFIVDEGNSVLLDPMQLNADPYSSSDRLPAPVQPLDIDTLPY